MKRRYENSKIIAKLSEKISNIEEQISQLNVRQPQIAFQEDKMLKDIQNNVSPSDPEFYGDVVDAKKIYTKIKSRRDPSIFLFQLTFDTNCQHFMQTVDEKNKLM